MTLPHEKIGEAIYPAGFYRRKAETIREISKKLFEEFKSVVPDEIDELIKFKGIGRKTANIVVVFGHNKPGMPVDVHVHRISNRLGWVRTKTPDETEIRLRKGLGKKHWMDVNELLVRHGQKICLPVSPWCSRCTISKFCERNGVLKSR
jgi:endonuclease III